MGTGGKFAVGRRVWFAEAAGGRAFGRIVSLPKHFLAPSPSFIVLLDGGTPTAVTCSEGRQGEQWDFAEEG